MLKKKIKKIPLIDEWVIKFTRFRWRIVGILRLKTLNLNSKKKIVLGASGHHDPGWLPTELEFLNICKQNDWERFFLPNSIDAVLTEHVWEHLTFEESQKAAQLCFQYLNPGGYIRVAVPDGYHPNPEYIEWVKINGTGYGANDHKILYTYKSLSGVFTNAGFRIKLLDTSMNSVIFIMKIGRKKRGLFGVQKILMYEMKIGN